MKCDHIREIKFVSDTVKDGFMTVLGPVEVWSGMVLSGLNNSQHRGVTAEAVLCLILSAWLGLNWGNSVRLKAEAFHKVDGGNIFMGLNLIKRVN